MIKITYIAIFIYLAKMYLIINKLEAWLPHNKVRIFRENDLFKSPIPYYMLTIIPAFVYLVDQPNPYLLIAIAYSGLALLDEIF